MNAASPCQVRRKVSSSALRAKLVILTEKGQLIFDAAMGLQAPWISALAEGLKVSELETAHSVIARLRQKLEGGGDAEGQA